MNSHLLWFDWQVKELTDILNSEITNQIQDTHHISNAKKKKINWDLMVKLLQTMHTSNHVWGELDDPSHRKLNLSSAEKEFLSRIPRPLSLEG